MTPQRLVRLYPRSWRERYGAEMLALLDQSGERGWRVSGDLLRGCIGAWLMAPLGGRQPSQWLMASFLILGWAGWLTLVALLTLWLRPAPIVWRAWLALAALLAVWWRLFTKKFEAGRRALAPELAAFEVTVLVIVTLAAGTILHKPAPPGGLAGARDWLFFVIDSIRLFGANVLLLFAIQRLMWPRSFAAIEEQNRRNSTSTLGLSG
jgi:hypothetical protein